jgi:hypothetical protein
MLSSKNSKILALEIKKAEAEDAAKKGIKRYKTEKNSNGLASQFLTLPSDAFIDIKFLDNFLGKPH